MNTCPPDLDGKLLSMTTLTALFVKPDHVSQSIRINEGGIMFLNPVGNPTASTHYIRTLHSLHINF